MLARYWSWGMRDSFVTDPEEQGIINCFGDEILRRSSREAIRHDGARRRWLPDVIIERYREAKVLDHLYDLVDVLGHMREGRTSVVLVTEGWRLAPEDRALLAEIDQTQGNLPPGTGCTVGGRIEMVGPSLREGAPFCMLMAQTLVRNDGGRRLRELIARANQRNISFIPVNPSGLMASMTDRPSEDSQARQSSMPVMADDMEPCHAREDGLRTLASNTDGTAVVGNNDLQRGTAKGHRGTAFVLPARVLLDQSRLRRKAEARNSKGEGLEVRARRGYIAPTEAERTARANPVKAAGPSAVELALDVLSGLRSADDRTFNVSRYLKADAAPVLGVPALFRATPSPRSPFVPVTAPAYTRNERIHIEWPVAQALTERTARLLGRNGAPLAVAVTLTERDGPTGPLIVADAALGALAPGDYVVELRVTGAGGTRTALVAFRVVP